VTPPGDAVPRQLQTVNELLPGYKVSYAPVKINTPDKKKARVSLIPVPSDHGKVKVFDPQPAGEPVNWNVTIRTQIAAIVYGPQGLDKGKVDRLVAKNDEPIGQLADYAQKTEQMQALIQAIVPEQESLESGQSVNAAVVSFANRYPGARLDRTRPADRQMPALMHGVNPALSAYDPLAQNPSQRAAQSAGLAAAVAGLFFGTKAGLAASRGALSLKHARRLLSQYGVPVVVRRAGAGAQFRDDAMRQQGAIRHTNGTGLSLGRPGSGRRRAGNRVE
jgi:hypothetical protein